MAGKNSYNTRFTLATKSWKYSPHKPQLKEGYHIPGCLMHAMMLSRDSPSLYLSYSSISSPVHVLERSLSSDSLHPSSSNLSLSSLLLYLYTLTFSTSISSSRLWRPDLFSLPVKAANSCRWFADIAVHTTSIHAASLKRTDRHVLCIDQNLFSSWSVLC